MTYRAPIDDICFALEAQVGLDEVRALPQFAETDKALTRAILEEAGKFAEKTIAPLNASADREGCALEGGEVRTASGFREAYGLYAAGGWSAMSAPRAHGGQGLPLAISVAAQEMFSAACTSFALAPLLTFGSIEALAAHGTDAQKRDYLPKLVSGEWTGTMNLTEPQAGSDVGALTTKAVPQSDGSYKITGTKIFISFGEHDLTDNIIHLVLGRLPDAPSGTRGISLFLVPKFLPDGARNDLACIGLERKLGIHASPTCVMQYGAGGGGGAVGWLVGEENAGMACMFTMMNNARLQVGIQGVGLSERAWQQALSFAQERKQGRALGKEGAAAIVHHADVRRMLLSMASQTQAARALCYANAVAIDLSHHASGTAARVAWKTRAALLTPISKAWSTDLGVEIASLGVQVHGGMGFIEETGAAQHLRDARITPIYEGTNGIQANDLVGRKLLGDGGYGMSALLAEMDAERALLGSLNEAVFSELSAGLGEGLASLRDASDFMLSCAEGDRLAGASAYLRLAGVVLGGYYLSRGARVEGVGGAGGDGSDQLNRARFYGLVHMPLCGGLNRAAQSGAEVLSHGRFEN